jgi:opacity protein-like surface antigen
MKLGFSAASACTLVLVAASAAAQGGFQVQGSTGTGISGQSYGGVPYFAPPKPLDNIGRKGMFVFGMERVTGIFFDQQRLNYTDFETGQKHEDTYKVTSFGLLGVHSSSPSALPRFALDYTIIQGLTAGATAMISTRGVSLDSDGRDASVPPPTTTPPTTPADGLTLLGGVRAGYAYAFDRTFAVWPRLGLGYAASSASVELRDSFGELLGEYETKTHFFTTNIELLGAVSPVEHIVLLGGPYLDLGLGGGYWLYRNDELVDRRDAHLLSFGFLVHAAGYY